MDQQQELFAIRGICLAPIDPQLASQLAQKVEKVDLDRPERPRNFRPGGPPDGIPPDAPNPDGPPIGPPPESPPGEGFGRGMRGFGFGRPGGRGPGGFNREPGKPGKKIDTSYVEPVKGELYEPSVLRTLFIDFGTDKWEEELELFHGTDVDVVANLTVDGQVYPNVGVRFRCIFVLYGAARVKKVVERDAGYGG